jgi:type II secretory pathway component PulC
MSARHWLMIAVFGTISAVALVGIFNVLRQPTELAQTANQPTPTGNPTVRASLLRYAVPSMDRFPAAFDRPLFNTDRIPAPGPEENTAPTQRNVSSAMDARLMGVVGSKGQRFALIRLAGAVKSTRLRAGDTFQGWRLRQIQKDRVVLSRNNKSVTLKLAYRKHAPQRRWRTQSCFRSVRKAVN